MKKEIKAQVPVVEEVVAAAAKQHPLTKSYMVVSKRHTNFNALTAFEAVSMTAVFVMAILAGTVMSSNIIS